jgi:Flp pilus assembly protein TadB
VSKARALARAEREAAARQLADRRRADADRSARSRSRREQRALRWRRFRLWQHGPGFSRRREAVGALAALVLVLLVVTYVVSRSATDVLVLALVLVVAGPVLGLLFFGRGHR